MVRDKYILFDWAAKRILRDKANFDVLEGLMTVLLGEEVKIEEILESEGNQNTPEDKYNRVDVMARNSKGEFVIIEVQLSRETYFLERMLYGVSKVVTDNMHVGDRYDKVKKVYSINILYFTLGKGEDYVYHGTTRFVGLHTGDELGVTPAEARALGMRAPKDVFPEYYIIRVNEFNSVAKTPLEEWIDFLKNGNIRVDTKVPGLQEARRKLQYMNLDEREQRAFDRYVNNIRIESDVMETAWKEGRAEGLEKGLAEGRAEGMEKGLAEGLEKGLAEGRAEGLEKGLAEGMEKGLAEGRAEERLANARSLVQNGVPIEVVRKSLGLSDEEVSKL